MAKAPIIRNQGDVNTALATKSSFKINPQHEVILHLKKLQGNVSDNVFAKQLQVSGTTWLRVKNTTYQGNHQTVWKKLQTDLQRLIANEEMRREELGEILEFSYCKDVALAIDCAKGEERNRLVVYLSPTGGGKSILAEYLTRKFPTAIRVEATETWRKSYYAPIAKISQAIGIDAVHWSSIGAESELLTKLNENPRIIIIDEGVYFSPASLNLLKAILNHTDCIIVILSLPVLWERMKKKNWEETEQLRNRLIGIIEAKKLALKDVRLAAKSTLPNWTTLGPDQTRAETLLQQAANTFGLWNTIYPALRDLAEQATQTITLDQVEQAISDIQTLRG